MPCENGSEFDLLWLQETHLISYNRDIRPRLLSNVAPNVSRTLSPVL